MITFLETICQALEANKISYALVGGYAVALHGAPRGTIDIDLIISFEEQAFIGAEQALKSLGLLPRLPVSAQDVFHFRKEYIENKNLIAWSFYNPKNPIEVVDIIITENLQNCLIIEKRLGNGIIKIIAKADLIKMKKKSARPQDLLDIAALEKV